MNDKEFENALSGFPGVSIEGNIVRGIRLLNAQEKQERADNAEIIRKLICRCCGADERSCGSKCALANNYLHKRLAAMIPPGIKLAKA